MTTDSHDIEGLKEFLSAADFTPMYLKRESRYGKHGEMADRKTKRLACGVQSIIPPDQKACGCAFREDGMLRSGEVMVEDAASLIRDITGVRILRLPSFAILPPLKGMRATLSESPGSACVEVYGACDVRPGTVGHEVYHVAQGQERNMTWDTCYSLEIGAMLGKTRNREQTPFKRADVLLESANETGAYLFDGYSALGPEADPKRLAGSILAYLENCTGMDITKCRRGGGRHIRHLGADTGAR